MIFAFKGYTTYLFSCKIEALAPQSAAMLPATDAQHRRAAGRDLQGEFPSGCGRQCEAAGPGPASLRDISSGASVGLDIHLLFLFQTVV